MPVAFQVGVDDFLQGTDLPGGQAGDVEGGAGAASKQIIGADFENSADFDKHFIGRQARAVFFLGYG